MQTNRFRKFWFLVLLLFAAISSPGCSDKDTISPAGYEGTIQIVILNDSGRADYRQNLSIITETESSDNDRKTQSYPEVEGNRFRLDQFNGEVIVRVFDQSLTSVVSQQLDCVTQGDSTTECSGTVSVPFGNYQVSVEARDVNNELIYFGIDTNVDVVEGETAIATVSMIDFTTTFNEVGYLQTGAFTISWTSVDSANGYLVERDTVSTFSNPQQVYDGGETSVSINESTSDIYYYRVSPLRRNVVIGRSAQATVLVVLPEDDHRFSIGSGSGSQGSNSNPVPVYIVNSDSTIAGFQFDLVFDPETITPSTSGCATAPRVETIGGTVACNEELGPNVIRYLFYFYEGQHLNLLRPGVDPVIFIYFDVNTDASSGTTVPLELQNVVISDADGVEITAGYRLTDGSFVVQ